MSHQGWFSNIGPAYKALNEAGKLACKSGTMVAVKSHRTIADKILWLEEKPWKAPPNLLNSKGPAIQSHGDGWSATVVKLKGQYVLFISVYFKDSVGLHDPFNQRLMFEVESLIHYSGLPFIMGGDFNNEPES